MISNSAPNLSCVSVPLVLLVYSASISAPVRRSCATASKLVVVTDTGGAVSITGPFLPPSAMLIPANVTGEARTAASIIDVVFVLMFLSFKSPDKRVFAEVTDLSNWHTGNNTGHAEE